MSKYLSDRRIGLYECCISGDIVVKGKSLNKYYYGRLGKDMLNSVILPDLKYIENTRYNSKFPVLITTWTLGEGDQPKPLPRPLGKLSIRRAGGLRRAKRMLGFPTKRKKIKRTEIYAIVINNQYNAIKVEGNRIQL